MKKKIAIIGSGIAGLTAANLLIKNSDFEIIVYEKEKENYKNSWNRYFFKLKKIRGLDQEKEEFCRSIGAKGTINRKSFTHWGRLPNIENDIEMTKN